MNKEELIKNQFPNDEFLQSGVLQIVDKCVADLEKENAELKERADFWEERYWILNDVYVKVVNENESKFTKTKELLEDVYKIAMGDWNDAKWHDQVLREAKQFLNSEVEK